MTQIGTNSNEKEVGQNAFEEALEEVNGTTSSNSNETDSNTETEFTTSVASKTHAVLFWIIFFLIVVLITIKGVLDLTEVMTLEGQFMEKQYTTSDIEELTSKLEAKLTDENTSMHIAYGLNMTVLPTYQVYAAEDGQTALVIYNVQYKNKNYIISAETGSDYFVGLNKLFEIRNKDIKDGNYTWDNSYIPEDTVPEPTIQPEYTGELEDSSSEEEMPRGGGEEDYYGTEE